MGLVVRERSNSDRPIDLEESFFEPNLGSFRMFVPSVFSSIRALSLGESDPTLFMALRFSATAIRGDLYP